MRFTSAATSRTAHAVYAAYMISVSIALGREEKNVKTSKDQEPPSYMLWNT